MHRATVSNLLGNSIAHSTAVRAATQDGELRLSVTNSGDHIPSEALDRLFQPFYRVSAQDSRRGLGLGLYIASEIARAHGGVIDVSNVWLE